MPPPGSLTTLVGLSAERLLLADKVAEAKFGTPAPIDDPAREQQVLDQATTLAQTVGLDTTTTVTFFRAQIEASKQVQRALFTRWATSAPTEHPDLATQVRPQLDGITSALIDQLAATRTLRASAGCPSARDAAVRLADSRYHLDPLHERALQAAAAPICTVRVPG